MQENVLQSNEAKAEPFGHNLKKAYVLQEQTPSTQ